VSVFIKGADGQIVHTYSCYVRGLDMLNGAYHLLDLGPKGRDAQSCPTRWPGCAGTTSTRVENGAADCEPPVW
jgi:predicted dithiol-disulfide oxidoreductase (DUF899 family)